MKQFFFATVALFLVFLFSSCSTKQPKIEQGKIIYEVSYPSNQSNTFLIQILPKEMTFEFAEGIQKASIRNANLQNLTWVDCNQKEMSFYFQYAEDAYKVNMNAAGAKQMLKQESNYTIEFVDEHKIIAGLECEKAIATNNASKSQINIWYTKALKLEEPNWYTPFHEINGVMIEYEIFQFGLHMKFKAKSFEKLKESELTAVKQMPAKGNPITFSEYNQKMTNLFSTFER